MSSAATIKNIAAPHNGLGLVCREELCRVPTGAAVVELKICETCGFLFARKNRDRNCFRCHSNPVPLGSELTAPVLLMEQEVPLPQ